MGTIAKKTPVVLALALVLVALVTGVALAQTYTCVVTVREDWSWTQECVPVATPAPTGVATDVPTVAPTEAPTEAPTLPPDTATFTPTETPIAPTSTPVPAATNTVSPPTPTATEDHSGHGTEALYWHAPGAHLVGGQMTTVHEHGDAPPQWVKDFNRSFGLGDSTGNPSFEHIAGTPNENGHEAGQWWKHTGFKGWAGRFGTVDWYGIFHLDFNPSGHPSRFHSYQMWLKDSTGAVSYISGWLDFGVVRQGVNGAGQETGPQLLLSCGAALGSTPRPVVFVNQPPSACPGGRTAPVQFENWYARAGAGVIDIGFNVNSNYYAGGTATDWTTWQAIGGIKNLTRRVEWAFYDKATPGDFWATQFGQRVSGPSDPACGQSVQVGTRTYTVVCLKQRIAASLPVVQFPGNAVQRTFPGGGVQLPN